MATRTKRKTLEGQQADPVDNMPTSPDGEGTTEPGQTLQEAMEQQQSTPPLPTAEHASPATPTSTMTSNEAAKGEPEEKKWTEAPDPFGIQNIDIGGGRRLRFLRSNRYQQVGISFYSNDESVDPKPTPEETEMLKEAGFERYRPQGRMRTLQLVSPEQKEEIEELEESRGKQSASFLRARYRTETHQQAHDSYLALANAFREKAGMEPIKGIGEGKTPF